MIICTVNGTSKILFHICRMCAYIQASFGRWARFWCISLFFDAVFIDNFKSSSTHQPHPWMLRGKLLLSIKWNSKIICLSPDSFSLNLLLLWYVYKGNSKCYNISIRYIAIACIYYIPYIVIVYMWFRFLQINVFLIKEYFLYFLSFLNKENQHNNHADCTHKEIFQGRIGMGKFCKKGTSSHVHLIILLTIII